MYIYTYYVHNISQYCMYIIQTQYIPVYIYDIRDGNYK